jgi:hypothetical protein
MLRVGDKLEAAAILPWLDTVHVQPGLPVRTMPEELIETIAATAACGGRAGHRARAGEADLCLHRSMRASHARR